MNSQSEMYQGPRDDSFRQCILFILKLGQLKDKYIDHLLSPRGLELYNQVFTHPSVNTEINYEALEILGDSTINQCIVWYLHRRFPKLNNPLGVKVIARLKINLVSKQQFFEFGQQLNLWPFVSAMSDVRQTKMKPTTEDVFEAFFGATQMLLDEIQMGLGNMICYRIIKTLFDTIPISLKYTDLYDPVTRLKETVDHYKGELGQIVYEDDKDMNRLLTTSKVYRVQYHPTRKCCHCGSNVRDIKHKQYVGKGVAALKKDARQKACEDSLRTLQRNGFKKQIDPYYEGLE